MSRERRARWREQRRTLTYYLVVAAVALAFGALLGWGLS